MLGLDISANVRSRETCGWATNVAPEKMIGGTVEKDYSLHWLADMIYRAKNFTSSRFTSLAVIPLLSSSVPPH